MAIISGAVGSVLGAVTYVNALAGEGWTRYFILIAGLYADNQVGNFTGIYALESLISWVIINVFLYPVFGISEFSFPIYNGISSLLIIAAIVLPLMIFAFKFYGSD